MDRKDSVGHSPDRVVLPLIVRPPVQQSTASLPVVRPPQPVRAPTRSVDIQQKAESPAIPANAAHAQPVVPRASETKLLPIISMQERAAGRYVNWSPRHATLAMSRYAEVAALYRALVSCQHIDFHVHSTREDTRIALLAVLHDAPFSETSRYPQQAWVELSQSVCGQLYERMLSALAFGGSGVAGEAPNQARDPYSDAKVQFFKARAELFRKISGNSPAIAPVDGVFHSQQAFEQFNALAWQ